MTKPKPTLIGRAIYKMKHCQDPLHNLAHVRRVVEYVKTIAQSHKLTPHQYETLLLATWWHDVGRTVTSRSSLVFMSMFDDILSGLMLFYFAITKGLFNKTVLHAVLILFAKSMILHPFFRAILITDQQRLILNILTDADNLDMLNIDRSEQIRQMVNKHPAYAFGYKCAISWFLKSSKIKMKTEAAKRMLIELMKRFISWIRQPEIFHWHERLFSKQWVEKRLSFANKKLQILMLELEASAII